MGWGSLLGFEHGIVQAPLGPDISGPELVAAVANAGGIGLLRAPDQDRPEAIRDLIAETRSLTTRPFGVGIILAFPHEKLLDIVLDEKVAVLQVFWGEFQKELVERAHQAGVKVIHQVGSVEEARNAAIAGVDAVIAQGVEAGGHVRGTVSLMTLVPSIVEAVGPYKIPVIAAGGIVDARGYVAALALGARGVCLGTRFVATSESYAHPFYKKMLVESCEMDTAYTNLFGRGRWPNAPHRVLKTPFFNEWKDKLAENETESGQLVIGHTIVHGQEAAVTRFSGRVPNRTTTGQIEDMVMYAGEGARLLKDVLPAASVIKEMVEGAQRIIESFEALRE